MDMNKGRREDRTCYVCGKWGHMIKNCWEKWKKGRAVMNIEWDYNYYQPWSDNEWLLEEMLAMLDEDITMQ